MRLSPLAAVLLLATTTVLPGCAGRLETTVRKRAARDFQCAPEQVQVQTVQTAGLGGDYTATGCGQESAYHAQCGLIGICSASQPGSDVYASGGGSDPSYGDGGGGGSAPPPSFDSPSDGGSEPASQPAAPSVVHISMKNTCPQTVNLFFGDKPKFGSGTYSTLGSNTIISESMRPGEMIWIVDGSQNGISSVTVDAGTSKVEINGDCASFSVR